MVEFHICPGRQRLGPGSLVVVQGSNGSLIRYSYVDRSQARRARGGKDRLTNNTNQWALKTVTYPDTTPSITDNPRTE